MVKNYRVGDALENARLRVWEDISCMEFLSLFCIYIFIVEIVVIVGIVSRVRSC